MTHNLYIFKSRLVHALSLVLVMVFAIPASAMADSKDAISLLVKANAEYNAGHYDQAIAGYESVMQMYGVSAASLYNLGNAYVKAGNLGRARLCYERARRLDPSGKQIINNLEYVEMRVADTNAASAGKDKELVSPDAPSFMDSVYNMVAVNTSSNFWAAFAIMAFMLLLSAIAVYIFSSNVVARKSGFFGGILFLAFTGIFLALSFIAARKFDSRSEGVVTAFRAVLRAEPSAGAKAVASPLSAGTKLQIEEEERSPKGDVIWYKVRLNSRIDGWVSASEYELI